MNPNHIFTASGLPLTTAIRPLTNLLQPPSQAADLDAPTVDHLPTFEALLALTNLASTDNAARDAILRLAGPDRIDDLLLSHNELLRRAAAELVCNLSASPGCAARYVDVDGGSGGGGRAASRLHILLALADVEDEGNATGGGGRAGAVDRVGWSGAGCISEGARGGDSAGDLCGGGRWVEAEGRCLRA